MQNSDPTGPLRSSLAELFETHRSGLAGAVRGILGASADVTEVLQDAFLRAWRSIEKGTSPDDPQAWIFVITLNTARDLRRKKLRRGPEPGLQEIEGMAVDTQTRSPQHRLESAEALVAAREAIHGLRDKEREVFLLKVSGGLTFEAIGASLGIPVGTAKTRMRRALLQLRETLAPHAPAIERGRTGS